MTIDELRTILEEAYDEGHDWAEWDEGYGDEYAQPPESFSEWFNDQYPRFVEML